VIITGFRSRVRRGSGERREGRRARAALAALVVLLALALSGCAGGGIRRGDAFPAGYGTGVGPSPFRLGDKFGYLDEVLHNTSSSPVVVSSITFKGAGNVLRTVQVKIAPLVPGPPSLPGGRFETDPPVQKTAHGCLVETLRPVKGFRLPAGGWARIWVVFQAVHTGRYKITEHVVNYTQNGIHYRQALPQGYEGAVTRNGIQLTPNYLEKPCLSLTTPLER